MLHADESEDLQQLGDDDLDLVLADNVARTIIPSNINGANPLILLDYNPTTGRINVDPQVDLSAACPGLILLDLNGNEFELRSGISNVSGSKFISIDPKLDNPPVLGQATIISQIKCDVRRRRLIRIRERVALGCHAVDKIHLPKLIYYILVFILKSRTDSLITRGLQLNKGIGQVYDREDEYKGENLFSRVLEFEALSIFTWDDGPIQFADCFTDTLRVPSPNPDSSSTVIHSTSEDD